jgi:hypothetical protein
VPRQHRHDYAAELRRGLPTGETMPASELTARSTSRGDHALQTGLHPPDSSRHFAYGAWDLPPDLGHGVYAAVASVADVVVVRS